MTVENAGEYPLYQRLRPFMFRFLSTCFRIRVEGIHHLPAEGPALICANHLSLWDPPLIGSIVSRPLRFMAKEELFRYPVLGWLLPRIGAFPVRRGTADRGAIRLALEVLRSGGLVALFPEGARRQRGSLAPAYSGAALLAIRSGAPVIPVGIEGRFRLFHRIHVRIGEPIQPEHWDVQMPLRSSELQRITNEVIMPEIRRLQA